MEPSQIEVVRMGGRQDPQVSMLAFIDIESRIPLDHPLRTIEDMADGALAELPQEIGAGVHGSWSMHKKSMHVLNWSGDVRREKWACNACSAN